MISRSNRPCEGISVRLRLKGIFFWILRYFPITGGVISRVNPDARDQGACQMIITRYHSASLKILSNAETKIFSATGRGSERRDNHFAWVMVGSLTFSIMKIGAHVSAALWSTAALMGDSSANRSTPIFQ
jgi:hypothetical protein